MHVDLQANTSKAQWHVGVERCRKLKESMTSNGLSDYCSWATSAAPGPSVRASSPAPAAPTPGQRWA